MIDTDLLSLARNKGSDKQYLDFIRRLPSAYSGRYSEYLEDGTGRCVAAHYRTAGNSGVGCKPTYSAIPLTQIEHLEQHRIGQFEFMPRSTWGRLCENYLRLWINS